MKNKIISCGTFSKFQVFPLLLLLFNLINRGLTVFVLIQYSFSYHIFFFGYLVYISKLLGGVVQLVSNCFQNKNKNKNEESGINNINQMISLVEESDNKELDVISFHGLKLQKTKRIAFIGMLFIFASLLDYVFYYIITGMIEYSEDSNYSVQLETINIILIMGLCRIILNYPIYLHSAISLILFFIGFCCYYYHANFIQFTEFNWQYYILLFIGSFSTSLQLVLEKYIMEQKFISPYLLLFVEGIIGLVINTIVFIILYTYCRNIDTGDITSFISDSKDYYTIIENFSTILPTIMENKILIFILILFTITNFLEELFIVLTNYYLFPSYVCTSNSSSSFVMWIILELYILASLSKVLTKEELNKFLTQSFVSGIGIIVFMIGILLYNEIIIIYVCGMDKNTKKEISSRAVTTLENQDSFVQEVNKLNLRMNFMLNA